MRIMGGFDALVRVLLIVTISVSVALIFLPQDAACGDGLDMIMLDNEDYEEDRKGPVNFAHRAHAKDYNITCWECHHDYDGDDNIWAPWDDTYKCSDCHDAAEAQDEVVKLQTAFHMNCKSCHEDRKIFGEAPLSYRKCTTCHE